MKTTHYEKIPISPTFNRERVVVPHGDPGVFDRGREQRDAVLEPLDLQLVLGGLEVDRHARGQLRRLARERGRRADLQRLVDRAKLDDGRGPVGRGQHLDLDPLEDRAARGDRGARVEARVLFRHVFWKGKQPKS